MSNETGSTFDMFSKANGEAVKFPQFESNFIDERLSPDGRINLSNPKGFGRIKLWE